MPSWAIARAQMVRNAAIARQEKLLRKAASDALRLDAADAALASGDIQVAVLIYSRLASTRAPSPSTARAKEKLSDLQADARRKLKALDEKLKSVRPASPDYVTPGANATAGDMGATINRANAALAREQASARATAPGQGTRKGLSKHDSEAFPQTALTPNPSPETGEGSNAWTPAKTAWTPATTEQGDGAEFDQPVDWQVVAAGENGPIVALFRQYDALVEMYGDLPGVGSPLEAHVARLRHQPEYAAVLNEMAAEELWKLGQKHERDDQRCCAYWVYQDAAELVPAPSALLAKQRFEELANDPKVVASAATCRELKRCHELYLRAERLVEVKPEKAAEFFAQIVDRAPKDSEIYREAKKRLEE